VLGAIETKYQPETKKSEKIRVRIGEEKQKCRKKRMA
jgi:hypothetical protein